MGSAPLHVSAPPFGSSAWVRWVFDTPPVDSIKGRTRWTQAHMPFSKLLGRPVPVQNRHEAVAFLGLEYLTRLGLVQRLKEHAFATSASDLGWEVRPDFFALAPNDRKLVIEVKTARFVTSAVEKSLQANREGFARFGMEYLLWTDRYPLSSAVRHNLLQMHRFSGMDVPDEEIAELSQLVRTRGETTVGELIKADLDMGAVYAAWTRGKVFVSLFSEPALTSRVSPRPQEDLGAIFLNQGSLGDSWWSDLPRA